MRTNLLIPAAMLSAFAASTALADPPNDCGNIIYYNGQGGTSTFWLIAMASVGVSAS